MLLQTRLDGYKLLNTYIISHKNLALIHKEKRYTKFGYIMFILIALVLGSLTMFLLEYLILVTMTEGPVNEDSKEVVIMENWEVEPKKEN